MSKPLTSLVKAVPAVLIALLAASAAQASVTNVGRSVFASALNRGAISGQNFDSLVLGTQLGTLDGVTYSGSAGLPVVTNSWLPLTPLYMLSAVTGTGSPTDTLTLTFATPITAFAIDLQGNPGSGGSAGSFQAVFNTGETAVGLFHPMGYFPAPITGYFMGFTTDTPFTSITISEAPGGVRGFAIDSLMYGNASALAPVPESGALAMLCAGLAGLGFLARKRLLADEQ